MQPPTPASVLSKCHQAGQTGIFIFEDHALDQARKRNIRVNDVRNALSAATQATLQTNGRWFITGGLDLSGEPVSFAVRFEGGLVIVTVF